MTSSPHVQQSAPVWNIGRFPRLIAMAVLLVVGCFFASSAMADDVIIYLKSGEQLQGDLLSITPRKVEFDPDGEVTFRSVDIAQVDSILTDENPARKVYPPMTESPELPEFHTHRRAARFYREDSYYCLSFHWGYRGPITFLKINFPNGDPFHPAPVPFTMRMYDAKGGGGSAAAFFPVTASGIAAGLEMDMDFMNADWYLEKVKQRIANWDGKMFVLDGGVVAKFPLGGNNPNLFLSPSIGAGYRKISADADTVRIEENHVAYYASAQLEWVFAGAVSLAMKAKVWNSELQDLDWVDIPRYTALEVQLGMNVYFY